MQPSIQPLPGVSNQLDEGDSQPSLNAQRFKQSENVESEVKPEQETSPESGRHQDLYLRAAKGEQDDGQAESKQQNPVQGERQIQEPPFSTFGTGEKRFIVAIASLAALFSPLSANIYYPALNTLSTDLHVSLSDINLTITTYLVCQIYANAITSAERDTDIPRTSTSLRRKFLGRDGSSSFLHDLFHYLHRCQYLSGRAQKLSHLADPTNGAKLRK